ncbi:MAG: hypothetical protein ACRC14_01340 [Paracoccaceae bacterium]
MTMRDVRLGAVLLLAAAIWAVNPGLTDSTGARATLATKECKMNALERSACVIEMILQDIRATYKMIPGGGIGQIRQNSTTSYSIELLREEHVDVFTYSFDFIKGKVVLRSKVEE